MQEAKYLDSRDKSPYCVHAAASQIDVGQSLVTGNLSFLSSVPLF